MCYNMWMQRTEKLIGCDAQNSLNRSHVAVIGVGGVGGYCAYLLARAGIGEITLVDFDKVDITNINRQIVADTTTIGRSKVDVMKEIILKINPLCKVHAHDKKVCAENLHMLFACKYDYVIDAIDNVENKVDLIDFCCRNDIKIVSAMGAGNRLEIPQFAITDIYKTENDGLAKIMRKKLRERGIKKLDVASTKQSAIKSQGAVGSISYFPAMCGCVISAFVINKILNDFNCDS